MATRIFQQAMAVVKTETMIPASKLPLPTPMGIKGYSTPYLRRRMHSRLRGLYG